MNNHTAAMILWALNVTYTTRFYHFFNTLNPEQIYNPWSYDFENFNQIDTIKTDLI